MSETAISINNLTKVYKLYDKHFDRLKESLHPFKKKAYHRKFHALKNINLKIGKGEILGIVGRNGAGKSTLLKILSGVLTPTAGNFTASSKISALLELGTGFNPQLSGIENIYLNGTIQGYTKKQMDSRIDGIISFAELGNFIGQPLKTYSSGMKTRLGFALAIHMTPEILILDEVLSVGDELFKRKCFAKMEEFLKAGITILYVGHSVNIINDICTRAIMLDRGELLLEGAPKLVTMYYMKFLYAKPGEKEKVRADIIELNRDTERKKVFLENVEDSKKEEEKKTDENKKQLVKKQLVKQKAFYLPTFKSKTRIIQKNDDVDIFDIQLFTLDRQEVNCLVNNEEYYLSYKMKFNTTLENIAISWIFKDERGKRLSGARYPGKDKYIEKAFGNCVYLMEWKFKCILHKGIYYIDIGVRKFNNNENTVSIAIYDALTFKVQVSELGEKGEYFWSICHMAQELAKMEMVD